MSWSYNEGDLSTSTTAGRLNAVRLLIGDTDETSQQVQDEEVLFALAQRNNNLYYAGAWLARTLEAKYARKVNLEVDGQVKADYSDIRLHYRDLAKTLEYQATTVGGALGIDAGGISKAEMLSVRENTDRVKPNFEIDEFNNPPFGSSNYYDSYSKKRLLVSLSADIQYLVEDFGQAATLLKVTNASYNPANSSRDISSATSYPVKCYFSEYSLQEIDGTSIVFGDRKVLMATRDDCGILIPEPDQDDRITGVGSEVRVKRVQKIFSGPSLICYICQVAE